MQTTTPTKRETLTRADFLEAVAPAAAGRYGAPMGRAAWPARTIENRGRYPGDPTTGPTGETLAAIPRRFYLRALPLDAGGYDPGGAYWGHAGDGTTLYAAYAPADLVEHNGEALELDAARVYVRARNRDHAKRETLAVFPGARFFDGPPGVAMGAAAAIREARRYVRLTPVGDRWALLYYPLPGDRERAMRGGDNPRPWAAARGALTLARSRVALTLMGFDPETVEAALFHATGSAYGPRAATIAETVEAAAGFILARGA